MSLEVSIPTISSLSVTGREWIFSSTILDIAIDILQSDQMLETADILLLQEMDESGTKQIAHALGLKLHLLSHQ